MKNYIGMSQGEMYFQELDENGLIRGFNGFYPTELVDDTMVLSESTWAHSVTLDSGIVLESGQSPALVIEMPAEYADCYTCSTVSCEVCSAQHDSDDCTGHSSNPTWTIINECEAVCMGCRTAEDALILLSDAKDVFKSKNLDGIDLDAFEEIECLFCDSSGFGSVGEHALTKTQCENAVSELLEKHGELYSGITGVGQFQVYISLYVRKAVKKTRKVRKSA